MAANADQKAAPPSQVQRASRVRTLKLPDVPYHYAQTDLPSHFTDAAAAKFDNTPPENPITDAGATLGRVLFYDTRFSANDTVSCGSCHVQKHGFADPRPASRGFHGGMTDRHAMNLVNLRYHPRGRFFWDERGGNLESMVLLPIENQLEMGQSLDRLPEILGEGRPVPGSVSRRLRRFRRSRTSASRGRSRSSCARSCRTGRDTTRGASR